MEFFSNRLSYKSGTQPIIACADISVREILACLDLGLTTEQVLNLYNNLPGKNILYEQDVDMCPILAKCFLNDRPEYKANKFYISPNGIKHPPIKFLLDENLSHKAVGFIIPPIVQNVAEVTQIHLENMKGAKDIEIWDKYKTNGARTVIVTRDDDFLTLSRIYTIEAMLHYRKPKAIQKALQKLPFVVHIKDKSSRPATNEELKETFHQHARFIVKSALTSKPRYPYIVLKPNSLGKSEKFSDLFNSYTLSGSAAQVPEKKHKRSLPNLKKVENLLDDINWPAYNHLRLKAGLESVSLSDYS